MKNRTRRTRKRVLYCLIMFSMLAVMIVAFALWQKAEACTAITLKAEDDVPLAFPSSDKLRVTPFEIVMF